MYLASAAITRVAVAHHPRWFSTVRVVVSAPSPSVPTFAAVARAMTTTPSSALSGLCSVTRRASTHAAARQHHCGAGGQFLRSALSGLRWSVCRGCSTEQRYLSSSLASRAQQPTASYSPPAVTASSAHQTRKGNRQHEKQPQQHCLLYTSPSPRDRG